MIEVVPAVLPRTTDELHAAMERFVAAGVQRVHLDICDGSFVPTTSISGFEQLLAKDWGVQWDVHLMVSTPDEVLSDWWGVPTAERFLVHVETTDAMNEMAAHAHGRSRRIGAAINPETSLERLEDVAEHIDLAMFMTVFPGEQGRPFIPEVLDRIRSFHGDHPTMPIAVDGGITPTTAPQCAAAGASILVSGSYVLTSPDIHGSIHTLEQSVLG